MDCKSTPTWFGIANPEQRDILRNIRKSLGLLAMENDQTVVVFRKSKRLADLATQVKKDLRQMGDYWQWRMTRLLRVQQVEKTCRFGDTSQKRLAPNGDGENPLH